MEKNFYAANGQVYSLISESAGNFYKRVFRSSNGDTVTERGCKWLGSIRTFRKEGYIRKFELSFVFSLTWLMIILASLAYLILFIWQAIQWLWALLVAFIRWIISLFKRKQREPKPEEPRKPLNLKWLPWVLGIVAVILVIMFWPNPKDVTPQIITVNKVAEILPRQTAIGRAYLDGEKNLLGCKYIFGKKAQEFLEGKENNLTTFESVSDASWVAQVDELLKPEIKAQLSDDKIAVITLMAMRNGEYGFKASKFLTLVNQGDFDAAAEEIWIFDKDGKARTLNEEGKLYTWCLWALWKEELSFEKLWEAEYNGYKNLKVEELYPSGDRHDRIFRDEFNETIYINRGINPSVREMKFFEGRSFDSMTSVEETVIPKESWWNKICRFVSPAKMWLRGIFGIA